MSPKNILLMTVKPPEKTYLPLQDKRIPLNIAILMAYLEEEGHKVTFIDNYLKFNDWESLVISEKFDFIGVYLSYDCWGNGKNYLKILNEKRPNDHENSFKIIVFGLQATFNSELIPEYVDYIIKGDPELAFLNILTGPDDKRIVEGQQLENIDDLKNPLWERFVSKDNVLNSDYDLTGVLLDDVFPVFDLMTVRNHQNNLTYCPASSSEPEGLNFLSASKILEQIHYLVKTYDAKGINFLDYNFAQDKGRLVALCEELLSSGLKIAWKCSLKPGSVDKETLKLMKKAGCQAIKIPLESGSPRLLDYINTGFTIEQFKQLFLDAKAAGLKVSVMLRYGWPTEVDLDSRQTDALLDTCRPDHKDVRIFVGFPKTELCEHALNYPHRIDENGLVIPHNWDAIAKKYLDRTYFSGAYSDRMIASNPIPRLVFHKKDKHIQEKLDFIDSLPLNKKIYFYGAGKLAKSFVKKYKVEEYNIKGFFDRELSSCGKFRPTKFTVYHDTEIKKFAPDYIFITMASREESIKVKEAITSSVELVKKPEVYSMFYEEV